MCNNKLIKMDAVCDIGLVRQNNEDMILVGGEQLRDAATRQTLELSDTARFAAIVADGIGGHNGGEFASEIATKRFDDFMLMLPRGLSEPQLVEALKQWTADTHRFLLQQSSLVPEYEGMGTTFCGLFFYESMVLALNIGDSRLYRYRDEVLKQITSDHSMRQLTGDMSMPSNQIYNSLGAGDSAFIDIKNLSEQLFVGDLFLICSDGLSDIVSDEEIEQILAMPQPSAQALVDKAKAAGAKDNTSVILLTLTEITKTNK